jgi:hypothetical protein
VGERIDARDPNVRAWPTLLDTCLSYPRRLGWSILPKVKACRGERDLVGETVAASRKVSKRDKVGKKSGTSSPWNERRQEGAREEDMDKE